MESTMSAVPQPPRVFWEEKISIEPDLGDQRRSTYKALPSPPKTPKRVIMKYRFSGFLPFVLSIAAFVLTLVVVLAGRDVGSFEGQYLVAINASHVGQDLITFERVSPTPTASSAAAASTTANPMDALNPFSTSNPLNPLSPNNSLNQMGDVLSDLSNNLTEAVNDGLSDTINGVVERVVEQIGVKDFYYLYIQKVCSANLASPDESNADGVRVDKCRSWEDVDRSISNLGNSIRSSITVGQTQVSVPLLAKVLSSFNSILDSLDAVRKAVFAFLVISMIGSLLSAISVLPAMYFPRSRLLIYFNIFWPLLATTFAFAAAIALSVTAVLGSAINDFSDTVGVQMKLGGTVLLMAWLSVVFVGLVTLYWSSVWFVETRKSSFVKRQRDEDEIGHWKGIGKEVWRDVKGRRKSPRMRAEI